jgi:hypothetical protein
VGRRHLGAGVVNTIASLTAMIPLGLVLMTSIAFAVGAARLAARQVLVNELPAVEGLARVDVICLDKTGTLTEGEITYGDATVLTDDGWRRRSAGTAAPDANATARTLAEPFAAEAAADRRRGHRVLVGTQVERRLVRRTPRHVGARRPRDGVRCRRDRRRRPARSGRDRARLVGAAHARARRRAASLTATTSRPSACRTGSWPSRC